VDKYSATVLLKTVALVRQEPTDCAQTDVPRFGCTRPAMSLARTRLCPNAIGPDERQSEPAFEERNEIFDESRPVGNSNDHAAAQRQEGITTPLPQCTPPVRRGNRNETIRQGLFIQYSGSGFDVRERGKLAIWRRRQPTVCEVSRVADCGRSLRPIALRPQPLRGTLHSGDCRSNAPRKLALWPSEQADMASAP